MVTIDAKRLAKVDKMSLDLGSHEGISDGLCVMEAAAYIAREPWSDHPECVCPVIGAFLRAWNDALSPDGRNRMLKPLIPRLINTRDPRLSERRSLMAVNWLIRTHTVAWLRVANLGAQADTLESLPEITSVAHFPPIRATIEAARRDAYAAAWAAATAAAGDAAWAAATAAAGDALKPTQDALQLSALALVQRMIDLTPDAEAVVMTSDDFPDDFPEPDEIEALLAQRKMEDMP